LDNGAGTFRFEEYRVILPKIGRVKIFEKLRWPEGRPISAVLRREGERWFLSVGVEIEQRAKEQRDNQGCDSVGVDLGLTDAVTLSTGEKFAAPKILRNHLEKLARLQRRFSKSKPGSNNGKKLRAKIARLHWRISQIRYDWQHKLTKKLSDRFEEIYMENLHIKGMLTNRRLALNISDVGWGELTRQLSYKTKVTKVGRFFASSKTCSCCGNKVETLPLNVRSWNCEKCGTVHDRDTNAALNIKAEGKKISDAAKAANNTASCAELQARGEGSSGRYRKAQSKLPSKKQELKKYQLI
jgi:putative transposase